MNFKSSSVHEQQHPLNTWFPLIPHTSIHILSHEAQFSAIKNPLENNDHKGATEQNKMSLAIDTQFFSLEMHNINFSADNDSWLFRIQFDFLEEKTNAV